MSTTTDAIKIIDRIDRDGINRETATELIGFMEKQRRDLATKQDLRIEMQDLRVEMQDLRIEIEPLKQGQQWLKWVMLGGFTVLTAFMIGGFNLLSMQNSDTKTEMNRRFTKIEAEMKEFRVEMTELRIEMKEFRVEMKEIKELLQRGQK